MGSSWTASDPAVVYSRLKEQSIDSFLPSTVCRGKAEVNKVPGAKGYDCSVCVACIRINMMAAVQGWMCGWSYTNSVVYVWIMKTSWAESVKCNGKWEVYILWSIFVPHDKLRPTSVKSRWWCSCKQCLHNRETSGGNKPFPGSQRKTRVPSPSAFSTTFHARVRKFVVLFWKTLTWTSSQIGVCSHFVCFARLSSGMENRRSLFQRVWFAWLAWNSFEPRMKTSCALWSG